MEKEAKKIFKKGKEALNLAKRSYVCKTLESVIRGFRECKTHAEERAFVKKESAHIRDLFREGDTAFRRRNVLKLLFFHMNGYSTDFGQMECLNLCSSPKYKDKRVGYLGMMVLLDENQESLFLITNCLKLDLGSNDPTIIALALTALGDISSADMLRDLMPEVEKHLSTKTPFVLKKATLAAVQIVRKVPEAVDYFLNKIPGLLEHRSVAVVLGGLALVLEICIRYPSTIPQLRRMCNAQVVKVLKTNFSNTHDAVVVGGVPEPFLQVKALAVMRFLGRNDPQSTQQFGDVLAQVVSSTDAGKGAANAVLYECLKALVALPVEKPLKTLSLKILGSFLETKESNVRYVALQELKKIVRYDLEGVQRFRTTIVECLHEEDPSLRKRAADVVFGMANNSNVGDLSEELSSYLAGCEDAELQSDASRKISNIAMRFAPSAEWFVDSMARALFIADCNMPEDLGTALVAFVSSNEPVQAHAAKVLYSQGVGVVSEDSAGSKPRLRRVSLTILGEYGHSVIGAGAPIAFSDVLDKVSLILRKTSVRDIDMEETMQDELEQARNAAMTCLTKLAVRLHSSGKISSEDILAVRSLLAPQRQSLSAETQQLACEYSILLTDEMSSIRNTLLAPMPEYDYMAIRAKQLSLGGVEGLSINPNPTAESKPSEDLLSLMSGTGPSSSTHTVGLLEELGMSTGEKGNTQTQAAMTDVLGMLGEPERRRSPDPGLSRDSDLLALPGPTLGSNAPVKGENVDGGIPALEATSGLVSEDPPPTVFTPVKGRCVLFQDNNLLTTIQFTRTDPANPGLTKCTVEYSTTGPTCLIDLLLQLAVPKYMKLKMQPATSNTVVPGATVTQDVEIWNSAPGAKPFQLRFKISYSAAGKPLTFSGTAMNLPVGL